MIDIVTINLNNQKGLERTIKSVLTQTFANEINYVIIDGGSTDGSVDVIKKYEDYIDYWVSEPDKGIYNAMNKALSHLKGDYVLFLNSGDFLASETIIERSMEYLGKHDIVYGNVILYKQKGDFIEKRERIYGNEKINESFFKKTAMHHQATFIRTSYHKKHFYDETLKIASDWKLLREAIMKDKCTYSTIPFVISFYGLDGISSKYSDLAVQERIDYYKKEFPT